MKPTPPKTTPVPDAEEGPLQVEKDVITELPEEEELKNDRTIDTVSWKPKTSIGHKVKNHDITHVNQILDEGQPIMEVEIIDTLLPNLQNELLFIGQSKGKFGGGQKRIFRQTQQKTPEGNKPSFSCQAVVGNEDGYVGIGYGKSKDTVPAREKAIRNAKLKLFKIKCGLNPILPIRIFKHSIHRYTIIVWISWINTCYSSSIKVVGEVGIARTGGHYKRYFKLLIL